MQKGLFITFEGCDGCGKTTQLELLAKYLQDKGYDVIVTREPGARGLGETLREILLNYDGEVSSNCESFLFLADRAQHIDTIVKPAIDAGKIVLCDRHIDSTAAYQGYGRGLDIEQINYLNNIATSGLKPNLTLLFDVDFQEKVRRGYLELAKAEPKRIRVFDSRKTIEQLHQEVLGTIAPLL